MEDETKNIDNLFAKAKAEKVDYKVAKVAAVIGGTGMVTAAAAAVTSKTIINLSTVSIMIGSIATVTTALIMVNAGGEDNKEDIIVTSGPINEIEHDSAPIVNEKTKEVMFIPNKIAKEETEIEVLEIDEADEIIVYDSIEAEVEEIPDLVLDIKEESCECSAEGRTAPIVLKDFKSIALNLPIDVNIEQGNGFAASFTDGSDFSEFIDFKVSGEMLFIQAKKGKERELNKLLRNEHLDVFITMGEVKKLTLNGSGSIYGMEEMESEDLEIVINGSGEVILEKMVPTNFVITVNGSGGVGMHGKGVTQNGEININGSGEACTRSIDVDNMKVIVMGSGDATINCDKSLDVTILGSGDVCYKGDAEVNVSQLGSGSIVNCDDHHH